MVDLIREKGYEIGNIDSTICLQIPKINPHIPKMKTVLATVMGITEEAISARQPLQKSLAMLGVKKV